MKKMKKQSQQKTNRRNEATLEIALPNLPNELTDKIFLNLPMRNLLEFRCVIRDYSRFHNPDFIKIHLNKQMEIDNGSTFIISTASKIYKLDFEALGKPIELIFPFQNPTGTTPIILVASCNGLLCLTHRQFYGRIVYLWNPVTAEYKQLPTHNLRPIPIFSLGFGYDPISGKFKVIAISHLRCPKKKPGYKIIGIVYTLGMSSWRSIGEIQYSRYYPRWSRSQVFEGCPHWIDYGLKSVLSFTIGDEKFKKIPMPPLKNGDLVTDKFNTDLTAFGGRLSMFTYISRLKSYELWVWIDDGFQSTWIKKLCFSHLDIDIGGYGYIKPWGFKDGQVLLRYGSPLHKNKGPILLNTATNDIRALHLRGDPIHFHVYSYIESLAMLTVEDGDDVHQNS